MRPGRHRIRLSRVFPSAASWPVRCLVRLAKVLFRFGPHPQAKVSCRHRAMAASSRSAARTGTLLPIRLRQSCLNYLTVMVAVKISSSREATAARRSVQMGWIEPFMAAMPS